MAPDVIHRELLHPLVAAIRVLRSDLGPGRELLGAVQQEVGALVPGLGGAGGWSCAPVVLGESIGS